MDPAIGLLTPVKVALGHWFGGFYADYQPDTAAGVEWAARGMARAMAWCPARMVDSVEEMLSSWRVNDNSGKTPTSAFQPTVLVAMANEYTETPGEGGRPITDRIPVELPGDASGRSLRLRLMGADLRAQVVVVANEPLTAQSIIAQLCMWATARREFSADYTFVGITTPWPVQVLAADRMAVSSPVGEQLTILTVDLTLRASIPLFYGNGGAAANPTGFPVVAAVAGTHNPKQAAPADVSAADWAALRRLTGGDAPAGEQRLVLNRAAQGKAVV